MGTRNLVLVWYKGKWFIAQYGQWDGYPAGQGKTITAFIAGQGNLEKLKTALDNGMVVHLQGGDQEVRVVVDDAIGVESNGSTEGHENGNGRIRKLNLKVMGGSAKHNNIVVADQETTVRLPANYQEHLALSRDTGGKILEIVANATEIVPLVLEVEFIYDSLFCKWAYVVDLDLNRLEVYIGGGYNGFYEGRRPSDRFGCVPSVQDSESPDLVGSLDMSARPNLVASFNMGDLTQEVFLATMEELKGGQEQGTEDTTPEEDEDGEEEGEGE